MAQKKLQRFSEIRFFPNVFEYPENKAGRWHEWFQNNNAITLELACGKGEYTLGMAKLYPNRNFIGVDIKGNRLWKGAKTALEQGLTNVAFIRAPIDFINKYFIKDEVEEIWIPFADPFPRFAQWKKRLTHPRFLRLYQQILYANGSVHLKTDSPVLFHFTKEVIHYFQLSLEEETPDLYSRKVLMPELSIQTHYEQLDIAKSRRIFYLKFKIDQPLSLEKDIVLKHMLQEKIKDALP